MMMNPDLMMALANERRRDLITEADKARLLSAARLARRARRARKSSAVRGQPTGILASCDPSAAVPAR
jgi:hypothetical protein